MKVRTKKVYYCDFCKKHSLRRDSLEHHEKHCTMNPKRICGLCEQTDLSPLIKKYTNRYRIIKEENQFGVTERSEWTGEPVTLKAITEDVWEGCPICILTILRLNKLSQIEFDYKARLKEWWEVKNAEVHI